MNIVSPYKVKKVVFQRKYHGYIYRREIIDDSEFGGDGNLPMVNCYSSDTGEWIGDSKTARYLCVRKGLTQIQKRNKTHCVCSIGFNKKEKKWYGWSHRAICGFKIGDRIFKERYGNDRTLFTKHGPNRVNNLKDAKQSAKNFARYVS